ncbi:MAG: methyltransferase domain-containing protein [Pseudomonadota bacterium]
MQPLFDHSLLYRQITGKRRDLAALPFLEDIAGDIYLRLAPIKRDFEMALNLYPPTEDIRAALLASGKIGTLKEKSIEENSDDLENLRLEEKSFDLVFSCLGLQFANDLPGVLAQIYRSLKPGGFFLGCLASADTLKELREAFMAAEAESSGGVSPRVHPAIDVKQVGALLQRAGFIEPISDVEKYTFSYDEPLDLLKDLCIWSPGNLLIERSRKFLTRTQLKRMNKIYKKNFSSAEGKIRAQFDLIWYSGWKKD